MELFQLCLCFYEASTMIMKYATGDQRKNS